MVKGQVINELKAIKQEGKRSHRPLAVVMADMAVNFLAYHVYPKEYYEFGFYKKSSESKKTYLTYRDRKKLIGKINDNQFTKCFDDKYLFSKIFDSFYGRICYRTDLLCEADVDTLLRQGKRIIYKPLSKRQGMGIQVFEPDSYTAEELFNKLKENDVGIVESWIEQSDAMNEVYSDSVNCVRVVTVNYKGKVYITGATLTVGSHASHIANADAGGIFALIDEETGTVVSDYVSYEGFITEKHPDTGKEIKGYVIQQWDRVRELVQNAGRVIPQVGYVSWDVAMTNNGPILIEGNTSGGYRGYQLAGVAPNNEGTLKNTYSF